MSIKNQIMKLFPALEVHFHDDWRRFCNGERMDDYHVSFEVSPKFTKIVKCEPNSKYQGSSVLGFICMVDNGVFKAGDLLKAASWKAPAKNFARGSIFDLNAAKKHIRWTGIA